MRHRFASVTLRFEPDGVVHSFEAVRYGQPVNERRCFECDEPAEHEHHVVPECKGGTKKVPLCTDCHSKVHGRNMDHRELIRIGIKAARAAGKTWGGSEKGRRLKVSEEVERAAKRMRAEGESVAAIARTLGLTRLTVYRTLDRKGDA